MNLGALAVSAGLSFLFLVLVFRPLEMAFPARPGQRFFRPAWLTDLAFFLGQYFVWSGLVLWALSYFRGWLDGLAPSGLRSAVAGQPFWLQLLEVVVLSDFLVYWGHRLQHRVGFLWRFHAVHHSAEHLDWLAAHREHPLDSVYTMQRRQAWLRDERIEQGHEPLGLIRSTTAQAAPVTVAAAMRRVLGLVAGWAVIGLAIVVAVPGLARRIGTSMSRLDVQEAAGEQAGTVA